MIPCLGRHPPVDEECVDTAVCCLYCCQRKCECDCYTHMGFSLRRLSSHEGVGHAVLWASFPVAGLVIALKLAGAPAVVQRASTALLAELHVIVDHLIGICEKISTMSSIA